MTNLNGRVTKLEATLTPPTGPGICRSCGLRHVRPLTLALLRGVLRVEGGSGQALASHVPLCLCTPCCGETGARWLARLSHGLSPDQDAA
jgi:hypothetical protein